MEIIWNVVDKNGNKIKPLEFDGRTQKDVVREICEAFESYDKVFFISPPGTGKSLIALVTIFNKFLKGIIVVPTKHLQRQYYNDYNPETGRLRIPNFKIEFIMGRSNFICPQFRKLCSNSSLPCTRRLKSGEKRYEICIEECPYWVPQRYNEKLARYIANKINKFPLLYTTASGKRAIFETECPFFRQFLAYVEADAIIMNDKIWYLETISKRKPVGKHVVEIIDEADHLLDSLGRGYTLRYDRLKKFLDERLKHKWNVALKSGEHIDVYDFVYDLSNKLENIPANEEVESLKYRLKQILDNIDDLKIKTSPADNKILLFYRYPGKLLQKLFRISNKKMLFMSATMQDLVVLQDYYWIDPKDVAFIYGKETWPGKLKILKTKRFPVTHKTWDKIKPDYIKYFRKIIDELVKRGYSVLIQAHAFKYVNQLGVPIDDAKHDILSKFIEKKIKVLASTRTKRGFDWRKDIVAKKCIIIPKFPLPDKQDLRIQALFENLSPQLAKAVYYDIARRELIQAIGRGLRSEDDELLLVVLDSIAYKFIKSGGWNMEEISLEGDINAIKTN